MQPELDPATYGYTDADMNREFEFSTTGLDGYGECSAGHCGLCKLQALN